MRDEVVKRRKWVSDERFLDLLGATNLIPGPNSTEMAIHLGYARAGWTGLILGGALFILPAAVIVGFIAWMYGRYGTLLEVTWLLYGVKPAIIAIVLQALLGLGKSAVKGPLTAAVGVSVIVASFLGVNEVLLLFAGGLAVVLARRVALPSSQWWTASLALLPLPGAVAAVSSVSLAQVFFIFLKVGSILFGSGYVLLAFLRADLVERLGWLTNQQLIDAIAVGQVTPGPVFTTATFIGYLLGSWQGAVLATVGIFLPSFVFVWVTHPLIPKMRKSRWLAALLDGVIVTSLGLMAVVSYQLGRSAITDAFTIALGLVALFVVFRTRLSSVWLILGCAGAGILYKLATT